MRPRAREGAKRALSADNGVLLPLPSVRLGSSSTIALTSSYIAFPPTLGTTNNTRNNNNISNNNFKVAVEDIDLTQSGVNILIRFLLANFHIHTTAQQPQRYICVSSIFSPG